MALLGLFLVLRPGVVHKLMSAAFSGEEGPSGLWCRCVRCTGMLFVALGLLTAFLPLLLRWFSFY